MTRQRPSFRGIGEKYALEHIYFGVIHPIKQFNLQLHMSSDTTYFSGDSGDHKPYMEELLATDYTLHEKVVKDFNQKIDESDLHRDTTFVAVTEHYQEETPVLELEAVEKPEGMSFYSPDRDRDRIDQLFQDFYEPSIENSREFRQEHPDPSMEEEYVGKLLDSFLESPLSEEYRLEGISDASDPEFRDL